jgi:hypothetical protein
MYIEFVQVIDKKYHTSCRRCDTCDEPLKGKYYASPNGKVICAEHYAEKKICFACQQPILGRLLIGLQSQKPFHPGRRLSFKSKIYKH